MRIYQLDASSRDAASNETVVHNEQAYMLTQWIEFGVFEAIERRWVQLFTASDQRGYPVRCRPYVVWWEEDMPR